MPQGNSALNEGNGSGVPITENSKMVSIYHQKQWSSLIDNMNRRLLKNRCSNESSKSSVGPSHQ